MIIMASVSGWCKVSLSQKKGVVIFNYRPNCSADGDKECQAFHLPLVVGDAVSLEEECDEWYLGTAQSNPSIIGIFPKSVIHTYASFSADISMITEIGKLWK